MSMGSDRSEIQVAKTRKDIARCSEVMRELRPHLSHQAFVDQVQVQMTEGYELAFLESNGEVRCAAGFRLITMLARGRHMYVDDLVTAASSRSRGYGRQMMEWLVARARTAGCESLELDSGVQRYRAHKFYFAHEMHIASYHFELSLGGSGREAKDWLPS